MTFVECEARLISLYLRCGLAEGLDALGAQQFVHGATLLHHERLLQVRLELAVGGALGE